MQQEESGGAGVLWKLGKSGDTSDEEEEEEETNNNTGDAAPAPTPRPATSCVRFKDVDLNVDAETLMLSSSDPDKSSHFDRTFSFGSKPHKKKTRQRMNTFSHCQYYTIKEKSDSSESLQPPPAATPTTAATPELALQISPPTHNFSEVDHVNVSRFGSQTAPAGSEVPIARRTFSFGGGMERLVPYKHHRRVTRLATVSGDSAVAAVAEQRRTFSFGGATLARDPHPASRHPRRLLRQKTISGDSAASHRSSYRSLTSRMLGRGLSTTLTLNSVDGSNSTILLEDWRPIFDKFDREIDGKQDGKIPLEKFIEILEEDPVWKESVPKPLKDKIIKEVDLNNDGVIDYQEFITLVKGKHLGLGSKRRKAFRQLLKETVEFLVPYKYTYQNQYSCLPPPLFMLTMSLLQIFVFVFNSLQQTGDISLHGPVPYCSHLIYNPNKREEAWRYVSYSLVHSGLFHVTFNTLVQLVLGIPLEMVHGAWRVAAVYTSGVLAGSLWTSAVKPGVFLSGASGGVYALITAHLGTVIMNHREMSQPWVRVGVVTVTAATDVGVYVYQAAVVGGPARPVSYPAHLAGAGAGLLVGVLCLRNLQWERHQRYIWAACLLLYLLLVLVAVILSCTAATHTSLTSSLDTACTTSFIL